MIKKAEDGRVISAPFSRPFPKVDFLMHFGRPLAHLWLPFGSPWLSFGSRWRPFGSLGLPFGSLWLPFGSLLVPFGSLLLTWGSIFSLLLSPGLFLGIFQYFCRKYHAKSFFVTIFSENHILSQPNRTFPKSPERTPTESTPSLVIHPQGPGAEHLPLAT